MKKARARALLLVWLAAGCGSPRPPAYPGELASTEQIPDGLFARHEISGRARGEDFRFEAVLQKHDGVLTVLGLTPFGTRAFVFEQRGREVAYRSFLDRELPFPPRFVLLDVHRALFLGLGGPRRLSDGEHEAIRAGERVRERWRGGLLRERTFERLDGVPPGLIRVRYEGGVPAGALPSRLVLENGWLGYALAVRRLEP